MERVFGNRLIEKEITYATKKCNASIWAPIDLGSDQCKYKNYLTLEIIDNPSKPEVTSFMPIKVVEVM